MIKRAAARNILVGMLSLMVLTSGWPVYHAADLDRSRRIDLQDAILSVRLLAESVNDPDTFRESVENAVTAMKVVSGLKTVVKPAHDPGASVTFAGLERPGLISVYRLDLSSAGRILPEEAAPAYESISIAPASPPPRA